jgi:glycosyltransferase involved in cell wall biosynthesis
MPRAIAQAFVTSAQPLAKWSNAVPGRAATAIRMTSIIEENADRQRRLLDDVDFVVGLNERALGIVRANGAPESKLVLNRLGVGIDPQRRESAGPRTGQPLRVGFIGRVHQTKGIDVLVRALLALPVDVALVVDVFGPRDPADERIGRLLQDATARDSRLIVHGEIGRDEVADALRRIDVLCCPSMWFENGPTVALEAHAVGTPVIGSNAGAMPEFIADGVNGRIVPAGRWEPLRDALHDVAVNPSLVEAWRRALPQPRTMDDVAREYQELYASASAKATPDKRVVAL